jgi:hypothetical protein
MFFLFVTYLRDDDDRIYRYGSAMRIHRTLVLSVLFLLLLLAGSAVAQIGFSLGPIPCVVACGDKGVINVRAPGELISNIFTGPTVDNFHDQSVNVVAEADKRLSATLDKAKTDVLNGLKDQREALITDLRDVSNTSLDNLDSILNKDLDRIEQQLSAENGTLQDIADQHTVKLQAALQRGTIFFVSVAFLGLLGWTIYRERKSSGNAKKSFWKKLGWKPAIAAVCCVAFWALSDLAIDKSLTQTVRNTKEDKVKEYEKSLVDNDYSLAVDWASRLRALEPQNYEYQAMYEKAALLRDVFLRPSIYKTTPGANRVFSRISQTQMLFAKAGRQRDPDVDVLRAIVSWQDGADRFAEYVAASACASALERSTGVKVFPTRPIATFYLDSYLNNPLSDDELTVLEFNVQRQNAAIPKDGFRYMTLAELVKIRGDNPVIQMADGSPFANHIEFGTKARILYKKAISLYLDMALTGARVTTADTELKTQLRKDRRELAQNITDLWLIFERDMVKNKIYDIGLQSSLLKSQFAVFARAAAYRGDGLPDSVPPVSVVDDKSVVVEWLNSAIKPDVSPTSFDAFQIAAKSDFLEREKELKDFEDKLTAHYSALQSYATLENDSTLLGVLTSFREVNSAASKAGLFGCGSSYQDIRCSDLNKTTVPAYLVIINITPAKARLADIPLATKRMATDRRVLPVV